MTLPASLAVVTLTGRFLDEDGNPRSGTVNLDFATPLVSVTDDTIVPPWHMSPILLDGNGEFSVDVPATNDPDWSPTSGALLVRVTFTDFVKLWWSIAVPYDSGSLDLADVGDPFVGTPSNTVRLGITNPTADGSYKGLWATSKLYRAGDTVERSGVVYGALRASADITPGTSSSVWRAYPSSGGGGGGGAVDSVFGRTGPVEAEAGDYALADITGLTAALAAKATTSSVTSLSGVVDTKADAGAVTAGLAAKANLAGGAAFTGTVTITGQAIVVTNDSRLTDARTPTAHALSHADGGTDELALSVGQVTGLETELDDISETLVGKADSSAMTTALAAKADLVGGVIPTSQIPAVALVTYLGSSANQAAMLAKTGQPGDFTIRTDTNTHWVLIGPSPASLGDWLEMPTAAGGGITSVNSDTGPSVVLGAADVGAVPDTRQVIAGVGLTGGGVLSADRTLTVVYGTSSTTAARGDDSRLSDARNPLGHAASHGTGQTDAITVAQSQVTSLVTDLGNKQPIDSDLTAIAALTPTNDDVLQRKSGAWVNRTIAQLLADLGLAALYQPLDSDLTTLAGLTATTNNMIQSVGSAWASRTPTQVKAALAIAVADVTGAAPLASPTFTGTVGGISAAMVGAQPVDTDLTTIAALTATTDNIIQSVGSAWASRTPAQVKATLALAVGDVSGAAPVASPTFTGTVTTPRLITPPVVLTPGTTVAVNAASGNSFRLTPGQNFTLSNPSSATDGQMLLFEIIQDGVGSRVMTLDTKFALGADITAVVLSTGIGKVDYLGVRYNSAADRFRVIAFVKGY